MLHYLESGLRNIWLANGYTVEESPYGETTAIHDLHGLHRAIGASLVRKPGKLTGAELRFLRVEMELSQAKLANLLGNDVQSIALWEKRGRVPRWADRFIRALYREHAEGNVRIREIVENLADQDIDDTAPEKLTFEDTAKGWLPLAA